MISLRIAEEEIEEVIEDQFEFKTYWINENYILKDA
jgi:hypothetical protein